MTGPEHYREAERLTQMATDYVQSEPDENYVHEMYLLGKAQVHATLALAAAAAFPAVRHWCGDEARDGRAWTDVTS